MQQSTLIKTTWNPAYIPLTDDGRVILAGYRATPRVSESPNRNPDKFFVEETQEWCHSLQFMAREYNMLKPSMQNRIARGTMVWYYATIPSKKNRPPRSVVAFPTWQIDEPYRTFMRELTEARQWSKDDSQVAFMNRHHTLLGCTAKEALFQGRGDTVLRIARLSS